MHPYLILASGQTIRQHTGDESAAATTVSQ